MILWRFRVPAFSRRPSGREPGRPEQLKPKADRKWGKVRALRANYRVLYGGLRRHSVPVKARQCIYGKDAHRLDYLGRSVHKVYT
jgi:hypothetical protein